ncbi:MAG: hypothetical protein HY646_15080 [Acidobacteria bacterium]|nr:hypothetical protein [Acidobacteriota bacterium]
MAWGIVRIVIFISAFLFGVLANDSVKAGSTRECTLDDIFVVPDKKAPPEKIPVPVHQLGPIAAIQRH